MATSWFKGVLSSPAPGNVQTAIAGRFFVDAVNGNDANAGTPANPNQTYNGAYSANPNGVYVMADGVYQEQNMNLKLVLANVQRKVVFQGTGGAGFQNFDQSARNTIDGVVMIGYGTNYDIPQNNARRNNTFLNNTIIGGIARERFQATVGDCFTEGNIYIGVNYLFQMVGQSGLNQMVFDRNVFLGTYTAEFSITGSIVDLKVRNSHFGADGDLIINSVAAAELFENCNIQCPITINGTPYADLAAAVLANPTTFPNCINVDPLLTGDPSNNLELTIQPTSPLIGSGQNNSTIGAFKVGELVDLSSPAENNDVTVGATITITNPATTGNIKPAIKTFSQIRKSPIVSINGLPNNTDNVPDNENRVNIPKSKVVNVLWRETLGGSDNTGNFLYGSPMYKDSSGNYTGEDDFNSFDIDTDGDLLRANNLDSSNLIDVAQIQENFVLNDQ